MKNKQKEPGSLIDQDGDFKENLREQDVKPAKGAGMSNRREPEKPRL